jgi:membrane protein DedA with SNARE-associated domain
MAVRAHVIGAAGASVHGLGAPLALALLVPMEAGLPVPIPADLVMLLVGERAAAGAVPLWLAVLAFEAVAVVGTCALFILCRVLGRAVMGRLGHRLGLTAARLDRAAALIERRGRPALVVGRSTPGLRTVTVVAAGGSGLSSRRALPALILGSSLFLQLHLFLGYALGPTARQALHDARGPALVGLLALVAGAIVFWVIRRGRRGGSQAASEACCPACLALTVLTDRAASSALAGFGGRRPQTSVSEQERTTG